MLLRERATGAGQAVTTDIIEAAGMAYARALTNAVRRMHVAGRRGGRADARARHAVIDARALAADAAALVQVPSVTGDERAALERLAELAEALGLRAELHEHDLAALRAHPDHPGEEAPRERAVGPDRRAPAATRRPAAWRSAATSTSCPRARCRGATAPWSGASRTAGCTAAAAST